MKKQKMISVFAKADCGCCNEELKFLTLENANSAFNKVGFGNGMTVVDDEGVSHSGLDTFYGFTVDEDNKRSLSYLFEQIGK